MSSIPLGQRLMEFYVGQATNRSAKTPEESILAVFRGMDGAPMDYTVQQLKDIQEEISLELLKRDEAARSEAVEDPSKRKGFAQSRFEAMSIVELGLQKQIYEAGMHALEKALVIVPLTAQLTIAAAEMGERLEGLSRKSSELQTQFDAAQAGNGVFTRLIQYLKSKSHWPAYMPFG